MSEPQKPQKNTGQKKSGGKKAFKIVEIKKKNSKKPRFGQNFFLVLLFLFVLTFVFAEIIRKENSKEEFVLSDVATLVKENKVERIKVDGDSVSVTLKDKDAQGQTVVKETEREEGPITESLLNFGVTSEQLSQVPIEVKTSQGGFWLSMILPIVLPVLLLLGLWIFLSRKIGGGAGGMEPFSFGQSKARLIKPEDSNQRVTFKDVAGVKEAKQELQEIVDFLKNPKKFQDIGARIPKGVLLMGSPGTGKTLLARATAGEAGVTFFSISGSEFVEMFVGVGASRVRDLFKMAKAASPSIIFIDEIDAVGRARGVGMGGGNDEREQTLNQILVEMDGFEPTEKVIVMAATNRPDVLDTAILRPGRFDRRVTIDAPDRADREEILKIHAKNKPLAEDVKLEVIAQRTPGFSGADLYSLVNEAAITAARENRTQVSQNDLIEAIEKVILGPARQSHILSKKEKEITAYHEAGHALVASILPFADPVHKISIVSRGRAGGYTLKMPDDERRLQSKRAFKDDLAMSLGGYVAEQLIFGDLTTGPSNDLQVSTAMARDMVTRYGMSDVFGPIALEGSEGRAMFGRGIDDKEYSEKVSAQIDEEVRKLMNEAHEKAKQVLTEHKKVLEVIALRLIEVENIEREEYEQILTAHGIKFKNEEVI
ncbi:MAG: cell division protein FtsH, cell division protease FtsH [Candidatus Parcubacteria bacterium]|jgi:cell division protease FtsH